MSLPSLQERREAAMRAPMGPGLHRDDTRIIERPGWYQIVTPSAPGSLLNEVIFSQVAASDADRVVDEVVALYQATGHPVKWCVGEWTRPEDFGQRLERYGFRSWEVRGMGISTANSRAARGDAQVVEIDETTLGDYVAASLRGWSVPADQARIEWGVHESALSRRPQIAHFFAARLNGVFVGTAGLLLREGYGYLTAAQVSHIARGRGLYRALVAARLSFLRARGFSFAVTQAREASSAPLLEHLGFETLFRSRCYLLESPRSP